MDLTTLPYTPVLITRNPDTGEPGDNSSGGARLSGDGQFLAFTSRATNLTDSNPADGHDSYVWVYNRAADEFTFVGYNSDGEVAERSYPVTEDISDDGQLLLVYPHGNPLVPGYRQILTLIDWTASPMKFEPIGVEGDGSAPELSQHGSFSTDARYVQFRGYGIVGGKNHSQVFVRDRQRKSTYVVGRDQSGRVAERECYCGYDGSISGDGEWCTFWSDGPVYNGMRGGFRIRRPR